MEAAELIEILMAYDKVNSSKRLYLSNDSAQLIKVL